MNLMTKINEQFNVKASVIPMKHDEVLQVCQVLSAMLLYV